MRGPFWLAWQFPAVHNSLGAAPDLRKALCPDSEGCVSGIEGHVVLARLLLSVVEVRLAKNALFPWSGPYTSALRAVALRQGVGLDGRGP
jgi:hypothetical protein